MYSIALNKFYLYKFHNDKQRHDNVCERFRNDCFERQHRRNDCPDDCLWYTEERWYFIDKNKQDKYFENKIKECERELKKSRKENKSYPREYCDKYGELIPIN
jgi:hypothetical protein